MVLKKSQSTLEYAALIAVATAAILGMQLYFRRGVEGKMKDSADSIGTQYDVQTGGYYSRTQLDTSNGDKLQISASGNYSFGSDSDLTVTDKIDGPGIGEVKRFTKGGYTMKSVDRTTTDGDASISFGDLQ